MPQANKLLIGITGGMGTGKSTAAAIFEDLGFRRVDSDHLVKEVLYRDPAVIEAVSNRFGPEVLGADGQVRRDRIAAIVFTREPELRWLEGVLHPRLRGIWQATLDGSDDERWVFEVPLLFEKGLENWFDFTVCVAADSGEQLKRLEKRGIPPDLARQRLARQLPLAKKCELADFVLLNEGPPDFLRAQVVRLIEQLPDRTTRN